MANLKFSIIIPTRERCDVLKACLKTVLAQDYDNLDIIVSDNASTDKTGEFIKSIDDRRIRYINPGKRLSMSHHWEFALGHVSSGWVGFIGDDDGLLPGAISTVNRVVNETKVKAFRSNICNYGWPGILRQSCGRLSVPLQQGLEIRGTADWLDRLMTGNVWYTDLPVIYQAGFTDIDVLIKIRDRAGAVFASSSPDVHSGIAIASVIDKYAYQREPIAVNGASRHSNGRSFLADGKDSLQSAHALFQAEANIPIHPDIPMMPDGQFPKSISVVVLDAYLHSAALRATSSSVDPRQQLELVLSSAPKQSEIDDWAELFSRHHRLDLKSIRRAASSARQWKRVRDLGKIMTDEIRTVRVGDSDLPLADVYEASLSAAKILLERPSGLCNLTHAAKRAFEKLARKKSH